MALRGNKILYKIFFKKYLNSYPNTFQYAEVNLSFVGVSVGEVVVVAAVVAVVKLIYLMRITNEVVTSSTSSLSYPLFLFQSEIMN